MDLGFIFIDDALNLVFAFARTLFFKEGTPSISLKIHNIIA